MGTARARETHGDMSTIRIGDLLDLSSPRETSICRDGGQLRSTGTVHHRPEGYQQTEEHRRQGNEWPTNHVAAAAVGTAPSYVKIETGAHGKCPNVLVRNGVICTPYREMFKEEVERRERVEGTTENMREKITQETSK